jgi:hypothetical protein
MGGQWTWEIIACQACGAYWSDLAMRECMFQIASFWGRELEGNRDVMEDENCRPGPLDVPENMQDNAKALWIHLNHVVLYNTTEDRPPPTLITNGSSSVMLEVILQICSSILSKQSQYGTF